ncbi:uncharacterized protein C8R40DRAFT_1067627 [Lentinula edodes]|uniref:uncharacterized protein n=1 Tax=Lentinula edodes TaxID=5353 RepID=UPI001E8DAFF8|nr:uncharacterized protein C8R40DRAFT_1067627 [Lentinula edodes]KAH7878067.1 hypothetical protein C8R40DRAFT_1067627 [Lentinula edodes]KAJ3886746.1 hypothetical protein GG344DRAFT_69410 [Lentinula edodes]
MGSPSFSKIVPNNEGWYEPNGLADKMSSGHGAERILQLEQVQSSESYDPQCGNRRSSSSTEPSGFLLLGDTRVTQRSQSPVHPAAKKTAQLDSIQQSVGVVPDEVKTTRLDAHLSPARGAVGSVVSLEATRTVTPSNARHWIYSGSHFFLTNSIVSHIQLPKILFNAGILSYLGFTIKLLWKLAKMFPSQPHAVTIGFFVPSVATFIFVQYYSQERVQAPKERNAVLKVAVDATILAGAFICTFIVWWMLSMVGEFMAVMFVAFHFGTLYLWAT